MPVETQNINIPLGAGLLESTDARRVKGAHALQSENAVVRSDESYQKAPGWSSLGVPNTGASGALALVSDANEQLLAAGQDNMSTYSRALGAWTAYGDGFFPPVSVTTLPTTSFRGQLLDTGIAHHQATKMTAVFASHFDGCVASVYSETGDLLAGPFVTEEIVFFPRVEAVTDGSGNAVFIFLGFTGGVVTAFGATDVYYFVVNMGSVPTSTPTETLLYNAGFPVAGPRGHTLYDTHSVSSHDSMYIAGYNGASVAVAAILHDGTVTAGTVKAGQPGDLRIFHDEVSETVLVSESGTWDSLFYANESLASWTEVTGLHAETDPHIYKTYLGTIFFSGESITLSGTGPGTPTLGGSTTHDVTGLSLRRPQPWLGNTKAVFFHGRDGGVLFPGFNSGESVLGLRIAWSEGTSMNAMLLGSDNKPYPAAPILQSLHGAYIPNGYINRLIGVSDRGHIPQTALMADGSVLLAEHVQIPAAKLLNEEYDYLHENEDFNQGHGENMDHRLLIVRLSPEQSRTHVSSLDVGGSTLAAMGGVHGWDGQVAFDIPGPPYIEDYDDSTASGTGIFRSVDSEIHNDGAGIQTYNRIKYWSMRAVLVFTDRLGNEWRSAPSPATNFNGITGDTGASEQLPMIVLRLGEAHQRVLQQGGSYDVEVYVTERDEGRTATADVGASTEEEIIYNYWMCQRTPLLYDGSANYYVPDYLKTAMSSANAGVIGDIFGGSRPPVPLYTDSGELAPSPPPACNQLAAAGNYCFLAPSERPYDLLPSKPLVLGFGPEFPPELMIRVPPASGGLVSLAGQGDRLVLLCEKGVYELYAGSGPDASGAGGFPPMRQVQQGDGCVNRRATVSTPAGVFYAAASGLKLVSGQGVESVGRGVQRTLPDPLDIVSAVFRDASREVWWFTSDGDGVCLNIESGVWTSLNRSQTNTGPAILSDGDLHQITTSGIVYVEDATRGDDNGGRFEMSVTSPWLSFAASQSWFRCRRGFVHGVVEGGSGNIVVELSYNYDDTVIDTFTAKYEGTAGIPNLDNLLHIRFRPSRQKFDAVKIRVYDTDPSSTSGAVEAARSTLRWAFTGLELEVAAKRGGIKLQQEASK